MINAATIVNDEKITIGDWICNNVNKKYIGDTTIYHSLVHSLNTIPVKLLERIRPENSFKFLCQNFGITSLVEKSIMNGKVFSDIGYPQLALGGLTKGLSVSELAGAYNVFPSGGVYTRPFVFTKILDQKGKEIITNFPERSAVLSEGTSYIISKLLNSVVKEGTARGAQIYNGIFTAGKTGTTSDNFDRWFCGFSPYYTGVIWYGYDEPKNLGFGQNPAILPWKKVMDQIHRNLPIKELEKPIEIVELSFCRASGKISGAFCGKDACPFYFTKDNVPEGKCRIHKHKNTKNEDKNNNDDIPASNIVSNSIDDQDINDQNEELKLPKETE